MEKLILFVFYSNQSSDQNRTTNMMKLIFWIIVLIITLQFGFYVLMFLHDYTPDYSGCNNNTFLGGNAYENCVLFVKN